MRFRIDDRIVPTFRPDPVVHPEFSGFADRIVQLEEQDGEGSGSLNGYLNELAWARARFRARPGTTAVILQARIRHGAHHVRARTPVRNMQSYASDRFPRVVTGARAGNRSARRDSEVPLTAALHPRLPSS